MSDRTWLGRLGEMLRSWFGRGRSGQHDIALHTAETVLAPAPPGGMRRVLPKRSKLAVEQTQAAVSDPVPEGAQRARANIATLIARGQPELALLVFTGCVKLDPAFAADSPTVLPLAQAAVQQGRPRQALRVMQRFDVLYPGHPDTPEVVLLSARCMLDIGHRDAARLLLSAFRQHFPAHALAEQADALAQRCASTSPAAPG